MAQLNPSIILAGKQPDFVNTLARSTQAAGMANDVQQANALAAMYRQHGPGIAQGDQQALNALAQFDPQAALGVQDSRQIMDIRGQENTRADARLGLARDEGARADERLQMARESSRREAERHVASLSAVERAQEAEKLDRALAMGSQAQSPEEWDQAMQVAGADDLVGQFEQRDVLIAGALGVRDALAMDAPPKPADEYQRYVQEEQAAGREPLDRISYANAKKGNGVSMTMPDGTVVQVGGGNKANDSASPSSPLRMVDTIDGILNDPAFDFSTGFMSWMQNIPGTEARRFGSRVKQLDGQAFLQAFESLKGAGQITEIEGAKATQAIGRLDSAQRPEDYRDALTELRSIMATASSRPKGWVETQRKRSESRDVIPADKVKAMSPDEIRAMDRDMFTRLPIAELKGLTDEQWDALEEAANNGNP